MAELKRPKYGQYDIYFSNILKPSQLERLAEADEHEVCGHEPPTLYESASVKIPCLVIRLNC